MNTPVDVFIPFHKKDTPALKRCVRSVYKYLVPRPRRVVIISDDLPPRLESQIVEWGGTIMNESMIPDGLRRDEMPRIIWEGIDRTGWYFQQFVKWAVRKCSLSENYVVLDSDTVFIRPVVLVRNNRFVFHRSSQFHAQYFRTFESLFGYLPERQGSFIVNYMIFNVHLVDEIIAKIEDGGPRKWYERILDVIDRGERSSFSEFETYGYYVSARYPNRFYSEQCPNWGVPSERTPYHLLNTIVGRIRGCTSISYHNYS